MDKFWRDCKIKDLDGISAKDKAPARDNTMFGSL